jgi:predicted nucleic acid-binding protein
MIYLDSCVFIYPVLFKNVKALVAKEIISRVERGEIECLTSTLTFDEIVWVIWRVREKATAVAAGREFLSLGGLKLSPPTPEILAIAVRLMEENNLKPRDAIHAATMKIAGLSEIISEDKDFDVLQWVKRYSLERKTLEKLKG